MQLTAHIHRRRIKRLPALEHNEGALRRFAEGIAEDDCAYGDGCPPPDAAVRSTWHGRCLPCQARTVLEKLQ